MNTETRPSEGAQTHYLCESAATKPDSMTSQRAKSLHILRMKQLIERTNLSRATLYSLMGTDPGFPGKIKLTLRSVGWLESEVDAWIAARVASRTS
jgi:prophage regulatory protein